MKVRELIETLQAAVAEVPAYADAEVRLLESNTYFTVLDNIATEDDDSESGVRTDRLYLMSHGSNDYTEGEVREWYV